MPLFRSWMFVPGSDAKKLEKVPSLTADVIIYDLEDAVAPSEKEEARRKTNEALDRNQGRRQVVRVNGASPSSLENDVRSLYSKGLHGIMIPKAESKEQLHQVSEWLGRIEREYGFAHQVKIIPQIESALGISRAERMVEGVARVQCFAFGSIDYTLDIGAELTEDGLELLFARSQLVHASRIAGIQQPVDTVYAKFGDLEGLEKETRLIKSLGFQGKLVIHPKQIETVNRVFTPGEEEIEQAKAIVAAYEQSVREGAGAVNVNGKMVDLPVVQKARRTLEMIR